MHSEGGLDLHRMCEWGISVVAPDSEFYEPEQFTGTPIAVTPAGGGKA